MKKLLKVPELAEGFNVSDACVRRWVLEGKIPYVKIGRLIRFRPELLEEIISQGMRPAKPRRAQ